MNLTERIRYKQTIIDRLLTSPLIVEALAGEGESATPESAGKRIYPYRFIQFSGQEPLCCISVDVVSAKSVTAAVRTNQINLWICCHKSLFSGGAYETRADQLAAEADRLLSASESFGIGRLQWEGMQLYEPTEDYYGYLLQYSTSEFSRKRS